MKLRKNASGIFRVSERLFEPRRDAHSNSSGDLIANTDFVQDSFGNVLSGSHAGLHQTGKEYFDDIDLYYFNARWYDPETGRFLSRAPAAPDAEHPYAFCENNPVNYVDPSGEMLVEILIVVVIVLIIAGGTMCAGNKTRTVVVKTTGGCKKAAADIISSHALSNMYGFKVDAKGNTMRDANGKPIECPPKLEGECLKWLQKAAGIGAGAPRYCDYLSVAVAACKDQGIILDIDPKVWSNK